MREEEYRRWHVCLVSEAVVRLSIILKGQVSSAHALCAMPGLVRLRAAEVADTARKNKQQLWIGGIHIASVAADLRRKFPEANFQGCARHTYDQAYWLSCQAAVCEAKSVALFVPRFHLVRNYLTVLEALRRFKLSVLVIPVPVDDGPEGDWWDGLEREADRVAHEERSIVDYSNTKADGSPGDVASASYLFTKYIPWLEGQI